MRIGHGHIYSVVFFYAFACLLSMAVAAAMRVHIDWIEDKRRKEPLEKLLDSAAVNIDKIYALYLSPDYGFTAKSIEAIRKALG